MNELRSSSAFTLMTWERFCAKSPRCWRHELPTHPISCGTSVDLLFVRQRKRIVTYLMGSFESATYYSKTQQHTAAAGPNSNAS